MKRVTAILLVLFCTQWIYGQISFRNQFKFTHWQNYDPNKLDGPNLLLNWADLTYQHNWFSIGLRYEVNLPPDPYIFETDTLLNQYDLTFRYAEFYYNDFTATVGTFYTIFGRGLTLRTYEERNLRVDNNIDGLRLNYDGSFIRMQALAGKMRDKYNRREDTIYGMDAEVKPLGGLTIGGSFLREEEPGEEFSQIWAGRLKYSYQWLEFYSAPGQMLILMIFRLIWHLILAKKLCIPLQHIMMPRNLMEELVFIPAVNNKKAFSRKRQRILRNLSA